MGVEPVATPSVVSACRRGTCPRCQRSFEVAIAIDGLGAVCPGCCNVLEDDDPSAEEVAENG